MTAAAPDSALAIARLRMALEATADALARADLDRLLECAEALERGLTELRTEPLTPARRRQLAREADMARNALIRCRRLGVALTEFARFGLQAQGVAQGYGDRGTPQLDLHSLDTTV